MSEIFLSYSREDQAIARRFADALKAEGISVWWDQALSTGEAFDEVTEEALEAARAVVVLWSKTSVKSRWVRAEATTADRNRNLMPVMIEDCRRPIMFELRQTADLSHWDGNTNDPAWRAFLADVKRLMQRSAPVASSSDAVHVAPPVIVRPAKPGLRRPVLVGAAIAVIAMVASGVWGWQRTANVKRARAEIPEIAALVEAGDYPAAFTRAQGVRRVLPDDSLLKSLTPQFTAVYTVTSTPAGAEVFVRNYDALNGEWRRIGSTPLENVELPRHAMRWRFEKPGFHAVERANSVLAFQSDGGTLLGMDTGKLDVTLQSADERPADMVYVPGGSTANSLNRLPAAEVPPFLIDRHEVTNAEYKEFIDAGGYERRSWWEGLDIRKGGKTLSLEEAMRMFVDTTGRPGPATWELGSFPEGRGEYPVAGVSWYEASAYARFRGKALPTPHHFAKAAFQDLEMASSLAALTAPLSNFGTSGPAAVGEFQGLGPYGTYDLFGNVREWIQNPGPGGGWVIGGSWEDPWYSFASVAPVSLLERSKLNGIRLVRDLTEPANAPELRGAIDMTPRASRDLAALKPVSDPVYAALQRQLAYTPGALNATAPVTMTTTEDWVKERITIDAGYNGERMDVILFVPRRARPPFQPVILFSGSQIFNFPATVDSIEPGFAAMPIDYIVKSGRMLVQPVFQGSYERFKAPLDRRDQVRVTQTMIQWRWDLGRTIDYLATRPDVDAARIGFVGISLGGTITMPLLAVEPRIRAAVLLSGGLFIMLEDSPVIDAVNYAPRVKIPVLMVNGRLDEVLPVETSQLPLFRLLGSPADQKRHVLLNSGHGSPPRAEVLRETLGWYDKYLGEVRQ